MKINELLANISNKNFDLAKELQVKTYTPIEAKKLIAKGIIYECTENVNGFIKVDSVQKHLSYVKFMIKYHTNLEYTSEDYDMLCSTMYGDNDLMSKIFDTFRKDADSCNEILKLMINDYLQDNSITMIVNNFLHDVIDILSNKLDEVDLSSLSKENVDTDKLMKFINTYMK